MYKHSKRVATGRTSFLRSCGLLDAISDPNVAQPKVQSRLAPCMYTPVHYFGHKMALNRKQSQLSQYTAFHPNLNINPFWNTNSRGSPS